MQLKQLAAALIVAGVAVPAFATDGYFQPGYSVKSVGMGGVGIAFPQDALAAAANPAGMVDVGSRLDVGLSVFVPNRSVTLSGNTAAAGNGSYSGNDNSNFAIPEFGYNRMLSPTMSVGIDVYGNGGMNTGYGTINPGLMLQNGVGGDLQQLFIAPTFSMKINPQNSIGVALDLVHQSFRANGLGNFVYSTYTGQSAPNPNVTDNGHDASDGVGLRLGWLGQLTPNLSVGASFQPKIHMGSLNKYSGLFAGQGSFDIPENYGIGFALKASDKLTVAGDVEQIRYSQIPALANSESCFFAQTCALGAANGPGFGWSDVTEIKLGVAYAYDPKLTLRAGYNHSSNPISSSEVFFNTIAPAVVQDHLTLGFTYALNDRIEISGDYLHAFKHSVTGNVGQTVGAMGRNAALSSGTNETLTMSQDLVGISLGYKF